MPSDFFKQTQIYDYTSIQFLILDVYLSIINIIIIIIIISVSDFISGPPFWYLTAYIWIVATCMLTFHSFGDQDI